MGKAELELVKKQEIVKEVRKVIIDKQILSMSMCTQAFCISILNAIDLAYRNVAEKIADNEGGMFRIGDLGTITIKKRNGRKMGFKKTDNGMFSFMKGFENDEIIIPSYTAATLKSSEKMKKLYNKQREKYKIRTAEDAALLQKKQLIAEKKKQTLMLKKDQQKSYDQIEEKLKKNQELIFAMPMSMTA